MLSGPRLRPGAGSLSGLLGVVVALLAGRDDALATANHAVVSVRRFAPMVQRWNQSARAFSLAQDPDGHVWAGTTEGLFRFDGVGYTRWHDGANPSLPNNNVYRIHAARDGSIWMTFGQGPILHGYGQDQPGRENLRKAPYLARLHGGVLSRYEEAPGLPSPYVLGFAETGDGTLWLSTEKGLVHFQDDANGGRFVAPAQGAGTRPLAIGTHRDGILFATDDSVCLLRVASAASALVCTKHAFQADNVPQAFLGDLLLSTRGIWAVVVADNALRLDARPDAATWARNGRSMIRDRDGELWVATPEGLASSKRILGLEDGLPDVEILDVLHDREGSLWVATRNGGVARILQPLVQNIGRPEGLADNGANAVLQDVDGSMWVTTPKGISHLTLDETSGAWTFQDLSLLNQVFAQAGAPGSIAQARDGSLWVATAGGGVVRIRDAKATPIAPAQLLPPDRLPAHVRTLYVDREDGLWLGWTEGGASRHDLTSGNLNAALARHITPADGVCPGPVIAIHERKDGEVLLGTDGSGLGRVPRAHEGKPVCMTTGNGLPSNIMTSIHELADGTLWVSTRYDSGIVRLDANAPPATYGENAGIPCDTVHQLTSDADGKLWMGCDGGLARINPQEIPPQPPTLALPLEQQAALRARHQIYDRFDGMRSQQISFGHQPGLVSTRAGELWAATTLGVVVVANPESTTRFMPALRPSIQAVFVNGRAVNARAQSIEKHAVGDGHLVLTLLAPTFITPHRVHFRYRLLGHETGWRRLAELPVTPENPAREIAYEHLPPGQYRFEIQARDFLRPWGDTVACELILVPPYYRSLWFVALLALGAATLVFTGHRIRVRQVAKRYHLLEQERGRIARDLHDGLAQGFAALGMTLDAMDHTLPEGLKSTRTVLQQTRDLLDHCRETTRRALWNLRRDSQSPTLRVALQQVVAEAQKSAAALTQVTLNVRRDPSRSISRDLAQVTHELPFVAQEAITNALVHGKAKQIEVILDSTPSEIILVIRDNGVGISGSIDDLAARGHFGILGMRERARRLDGDLAVESQPGTGTTIKAVIPIELEETKK